MSRNLSILPIALLAGLIFCGLGSIAEILTWLARLVFHEIGHALIFWSRSILAVPSFGLTVPLHSETSFLVFAALLGLFVWAARVSKTSGYVFLSLLCKVFLVLLICFTLLIPSRTGEMVMLFGGLGGELYLATIGLMLFYQPMPKRFEWDRNRYLILVISTLSFCGALVHWYRIRNNHAQLPMGGMLDLGALSNPNSESSGDLDRLIREFGWTTDTIVSVYSSTVLLCVAALILYYLYLWYQGSSGSGEEIA
ncbi:MAG: hypothetical protein J0M12_16590 [Deltaproteobacteria bacterium]|nr:hypothetical protein [Deltaproteobacteria bacterium]